MFRCLGVLIAWGGNNETRGIRIYRIVGCDFLHDTGRSADVRAEKRIAMLLWDEDSRFVDCAKGVLDQLKGDGYGEPGVTITMENAQGSKLKLAELVTKFANAKPDMIVSLGTMPTIAVTKEIKDIPVVFGMVYDPVEAGIAKSWKSSGNNTTGASPLIPMSTLVARSRK